MMNAWKIKQSANLGIEVEVAIGIK